MTSLKEEYLSNVDKIECVPDRAAMKIGDQLQVFHVALVDPIRREFSGFSLVYIPGVIRRAGPDWGEFNSDVSFSYLQGLGLLDRYCARHRVYFDVESVTRKKKAERWFPVLYCKRDGRRKEDVALIKRHILSKEELGERKLSKETLIIYKMI